MENIIDNTADSQTDYILVYDTSIVVGFLTNEYPLTFYDVRMKFPNTGFPIPCRDYVLEPYGYAPVLESPYPSKDLGKIVEGFPTQKEDGRWYQTWNIIPYTEEEYAQELTNRKTDLILATRSFFENDLNLGINVSFNGSVYTIKVIATDLLNFIVVRDLAARNPTETFTLRSEETVFQNLSAADATTLANAVIDRYYELYSAFTSYVATVQAATVFSELPALKYTFLEG